MTLDDLRRRLGQRRAELHALDVVILAGGGSKEREVSLRSGSAVVQAVLSAGYTAELLSLGQDDITFESVPLPTTSTRDQIDAASVAETAAMSQLVNPPPRQSSISRIRSAGMVLTTLHGARGENGAWQGVLELLGVPYVSAGVKGSALAMDKAIAKRIAVSLEIPTPLWWLQKRTETCRNAVPNTVRELVAKPVSEGSSVGIVMCQNDDDGWTRILALNEQFDPLLIEERIHGEELTAAVIGDSTQPIPLPLVRIKSSREFYDYSAKYTAGQTEYECPASISDRAVQMIQQRSADLYEVLDLGPYARLDFMLDNLGQAWFLEANTLPGFTELSLLPMAARAAGVEMPELLELLMLLALERAEQQAQSAAAKSSRSAQ